MRTLALDMAGSYESLISAQALKAEGYLIAVHKATEGLTFVDKRVVVEVPLLRIVGEVVGLYHFFRPRYDCLEQAAHFHNITKNLDYQFVVLDWETTDNLLTPSKQIDWVIKCGNELRRLTGKVVALYSGMWFLNQFSAADKARLREAFPLFWNAAFWYQPQTVEAQAKAVKLVQASTGPDVKPWEKWWLWQWTDTGQLAGINGRVDLDITQGTFEEFCESVKVIPETTPDFLHCIYEFLKTLGYTGPGPKE